MKINSFVQTVLLVAILTLAILLVIDMRLQWFEREERNSALRECVTEYNASDAKFIDGQAYCLLIYQGASYIQRLEYLREIKAQRESGK